MKTAIVTGASRGIGAATAKLLAAKGYAVAVNYKNSHTDAEKVLEEITQKGGQGMLVKADVAVEADVIKMFSAVNQKLGNITVLINNAAVNPTCSVEETQYQMLVNVFHTNVFGAFIASREAVRFMRDAGGGAIVNISSEAARFGGNRMAHYAASKAAINTFTVGFAREVAPYNIRVNAVSPGIIDTEAHADATPERMSAIKSSLPMGRMGKPEEVAETIAWLLSDAASYVSGSVFSVTGAR